MNDRAQDSAIAKSANSDGAVNKPGPHSDAVLARALGRARLAVLWEGLWPAVAVPATAVGLFLAVSWLGVWQWLPPVGRAIGLGLFFLLAVAASLPLARLRLPTREDGLRRLPTPRELERVLTALTLDDHRLDEVRPRFGDRRP